MLRKALFTTLLCLLTIGAAEAQWKWRDAKGNVQYSDMPPPPGTAEKDILQRPNVATRPVVVGPAAAAAASAASAPKPAASTPSKADQEAIARQKKDQDSEAARKKEEERKFAEQRRENCARAQGALRELQNGQRLTRTNDKGERVFMDEAQIAAEVNRARDVITSECR